MGNSRETDDLVVIEDGFKPVEEILAEAGIEGGGGPTRWGSSFWARAKRCPYDGLLIHRDGNEPARSQALVIGILFHVAMAIWYRTRDRSQALRVCQEVLSWCQRRLAEGSATWPSELWGYATATQNLVVSYLATWQAPPDPTRFTLEALEHYDPPPQRVVLIEHALGIEPPQSKFPVSGRIDLACVVQDPMSGAEMGVIIDSKTTRHETPEWLEAWWQDDQLCSLFHLWQKVLEPLGWPKVAAVVINMVEKPRSRNDMPNFKRHVFKLRPDRINVWARQMEFAWEEFSHFQDIAAAEGGAISWQTVRQNWSACFGRRYSICPRLDHCITLRDMSVYSSLPRVMEPPQVASAMCSDKPTANAPAAAPPLTSPVEKCDAQPTPLEPAPLRVITTDAPPVVTSPAAAPAPPLTITMAQIMRLTTLAQTTGLPPAWTPTTWEALCDAVFAIYGKPVTDISSGDADQLITLLSAAPAPQQAPQPVEPAAPPAPTATAAATAAATAKADEPMTREQLDALEKARLKACWTVAQVLNLALDMFGNGAASEGSLTLTRPQAKLLILQVLDAASDLVQLDLPETGAVTLESVGKDLHDLTGGVTDVIISWLAQAPEPSLREYAARFTGQGDRFNNIKHNDLLRIEIAKATLEETQAQVAAKRGVAPPAEVTLADLIAQVTACPKWKVIKFHAKQQVPVSESVTGNWYLVRGLVAMATPQRTEKERTFILDSGVPLGVGYMKDDVTPNVAVPCDVVKDEPGALPTPPAVDPNAPEAPQGEPGLPRQVGEAAKPTGVVKVFWLGHHKRQQKAKDLLQGLFKDEGDCFGVALCGKAPETEKLKAFTFASGVAVETTAKVVGGATWEHFGTLVVGL
jgi:hypothetical protein